MYIIVIWMDEDTMVPSAIGPYSDDSAFKDADSLRTRCYKVQVVNCTLPENSFALRNLKLAN